MIRSLSVFITILLLNYNFSQTDRLNKMEALSFLEGNWEGTSSSLKQDSVVEMVKAKQTIQYGLDKHILIIDLASENLDLHTIIYYDDKEANYSYNPFYKNGAGSYSAELSTEGQLIVRPNEQKRFIFQVSNGKLQEYGETLENGVWTRYFEDNFVKVTP